MDSSSKFIQFPSESLESITQVTIPPIPPTYSTKDESNESIEYVLNSKHEQTKSSFPWKEFICFALMS